jgi:hypothetical protein
VRIGAIVGKRGNHSGAGLKTITGFARTTSYKPIRRFAQLPTRDWLSRSQVVSRLQRVETPLIGR